MSIPTRLTFTHVKNVIIAANKTTKPPPLGRWGLKKNVGLAVDYSNVDHCGSCGEYLNKKQLDNKSQYDKEKILEHEYSSMLLNTPN